MTGSRGSLTFLLLLLLVLLLLAEQRSTSAALRSRPLKSSALRVSRLLLLHWSSHLAEDIPRSSSSAGLTVSVQKARSKAAATGSELSAENRRIRRNSPVGQPEEGGIRVGPSSGRKIAR